jgi:hypothetical protein
LVVSPLAVAQALVWVALEALLEALHLDVVSARQAQCVVQVRLRRDIVVMAAQVHASRGCCCCCSCSYCRRRLLILAYTLRSSSRTTATVTAFAGCLLIIPLCGFLLTRLAVYEQLELW